jgi:hypothetical protein
MCFLIRNHLAMTHMAFRKDLHDDAMLSRFAETLMHKRMLDMLMLLTQADLKAIGPRGFSSWRGYLLEELYYRTLDVFEGESAQGEDLGEWLQQIKAVVKESVPPEKRGPKLDRFLAEAPPLFLDFSGSSRTTAEVLPNGTKRIAGLTTSSPQGGPYRPGYEDHPITHDRTVVLPMAGTHPQLNHYSAWSHNRGR